MKPGSFIALALVTFPFIFNGVPTNAAPTQVVGNWVCQTADIAPPNRPVSTSTLMINENGQLNWLLSIELYDERGELNTQVRIFAEWAVTDTQFSMYPSILLLKKLEINGENRLDTGEAQRLEDRFLDKYIHQYQIEKSDPIKLIFFNHQRRVACKRETKRPQS